MADASRERPIPAYTCVMTIEPRDQRHETRQARELPWVRSRWPLNTSDAKLDGVIDERF